jgi:alanyl-tRNA synthetase
MEVFKMMTSNEIRERFLDYFIKNEHTRVSSSSLVPHDDPTLLFTNAGMNQFKQVFIGKKTLPFKRATSSQKCVRAGGKHNDLESVGRTARHHTFFEMLGNFSFGDYFKEKAIEYAWEFLTEVMELPKERLWVSVYKEDDEAYNLWIQVAKIPQDRIVRLGEKDNFWSMGDTGPCGPCSEIYIDRGEEYSCNRSKCKIGECDCDRWRELWNLVFMQYNKDDNGVLRPLPNPSIDTGMGLERMATVMQNVYSNYDTDLLRPIIAFVENRTGKKYYGDNRGFPFRVIADHSRAFTFLISDGVIPGNEGRNYVLRRILRRAVRYCKELGINEPFLYKTVPVIVSLMKDAYPELQNNMEYIQKMIRLEEERFHATLSEGLRMLYEGIDKIQGQQKKVISGEMAFMLYDTYGFPLDLTRDVAEEKGFEVDIKVFEKLMKNQREKAKSARKTNFESDVLSELLSNVPPTQFLGYDQLVSKARVIKIIQNEEIVETTSANDTSDETILVLDRTPFYAEAGGQIGDKGVIKGDNFEFLVENTLKTSDGKIYHLGNLSKGCVNINDNVVAAVDGVRRKSISRNHSATHLLHKALKDVLGGHVNQAGSLVDQERLRFDFSHFASMTPQEIRKVEDIVNEVILKNLPVKILETTVNEAQELGAVALFGEKYGQKVRLVTMGDYSKELCGGTHVKYTAEIGLFKIVSESSIGSGLRRIEAVTGTNLLNYFALILENINNIADILKVSTNELKEKIEEILRNRKEAEREIESFRQQMINTQVEKIFMKKATTSKIDFISSKVEIKEIDDLRKLCDALKAKLASGIIVLGGISGHKVYFVAAVTDDLVSKGFHAGKIVRQVAQIAGGSGGGRKDFAQAGGKYPDRIDEALKEVQTILNKTE